MRTSLFLLVAAAFCLASTADAQIRFLPYIGYGTNLGFDFSASPDNPTGGVLVGVGVETSLTPGILPVSLKVRPSVETAFVSGGDVVTNTSTSTTAFRAGLDLIVDISAPMAPVGFFAGAGATYMSYKATADGFDDLTGSGIGANLLAGVRFGGGFISPFVQGRYTLGSPSPDELSITLGNSFSVQAGASIGL